MKIKFQEEDNGIKTVSHKSLAELLVGRTVVMDDDQSFMIRYVSPDNVTLEQVSSTDACARLALKYKADDTLERIRNNTFHEVLEDLSRLLNDDAPADFTTNTAVTKQLWEKRKTDGCIRLEDRLLAAGSLVLALLDRGAAGVQKARDAADQMMHIAVTNKRITPDYGCICGYKGSCKVKRATLVPDELLKVLMDCPKCGKEITVERILK
ncbi:MAG: hypothetical protein WC907_06060 [Acholeplasmataceae bacterium]|jgi:hypothetical protein